MRKFFSFLYQFFFVDQVKGHISHTKFFSIVGYAAMTWAFCFVIYQGESSIDPTLWLIFGTVCIGNRTLGKFVKND